MELTLNGEIRQFSSPMSVAELVPRGLHAEVMLAEGDRLEIVVAVGGG